MNLIDLIKLYNISKKQLLLNLANTLKSSTKKNQKKEKKKKVLKNFLYLSML